MNKKSVAAPFYNKNNKNNMHSVVFSWKSCTSEPVLIPIIEQNILFSILLLYLNSLRL